MILTMYSVTGFRPEGQSEHDAVKLRVQSETFQALQLVSTHQIWLHSSGRRGAVG